MAALNEQAQANLDHALSVLNGDGPVRFPEVFGKGASERCIEVPWSAQWLRDPGAILDVGYSLSSLDWLGVLMQLAARQDVSLHALDIVKPERVMTRYPEDWREQVLSVETTIGDVREVDFGPERFDTVTCISTLEHVGFDEAAPEGQKTAFKRAENPADVPMTRDPQVTTTVLQNFRDWLRPGGRILLTMPMGKGGPALLRDSLGLYTRQWEYNAESWAEVTAVDGLTLLENRFFGFESEGWREVAGPSDLATKSSDQQPHAHGAVVSVFEKSA